MTNGDWFPYEIGLGGLVAVAAAFQLGRMCRPTRPGVSTPARAIEAISAVRPTNLIRRLDELETLMDLGILTREEFETEKDKLRNC